MIGSIITMLMCANAILWFVFLISEIIISHKQNKRYNELLNEMVKRIKRLEVNHDNDNMYM